MDTIAVGTDGSESAAKALDAAIDLAVIANASLVVISAYSPGRGPDPEKLREELPHEDRWAVNPNGEVDSILLRAVRLARSHGLDVRSVASAGNPADVLCEHAASEQADVLVIGNKGIQRRMLNNVVHRIASHAPCAVLIVKTT